MKKPISNRDWESLSAYLDGELNARESARLENRLQTSADLRAALDDLQRMRTLLRSQPRLRAPRNFTISASTAAAWKPERSQHRLSPVFGTVSAFASFLLVVVFLGEFLLAGSMRGAMLPAASMPVSEEREALQMDAGTSEASSEIAPLYQSAAEEPAATELIVAEQAPTEADMTAKALASPASPDVEAGALPAPVVEAPMEMAASATEVAPTGTALPSPTATIGATSLSLAPTEVVATTLDEAAAEASPAHQPIGGQPFWTGWRVVELVLVFLALAAGITAIYLRRAEV